MEEGMQGLAQAGLDAGLTGNAFKVLLAMGLAVRPGAEAPACDVRHRELARRAGVCATTLTRCAVELEGKGLIAKRRARPHDARSGTVYLLLAAGKPAEAETQPGTCPDGGQDGEAEPLETKLGFCEKPSFLAPAQQLAQGIGLRSSQNLGLSQNP